MEVLAVDESTLYATEEKERDIVGVEVAVSWVDTSMDVLAAPGNENRMSSNIENANPKNRMKYLGLFRRIPVFYLIIVKIAN